MIYKLVLHFGSVVKEFDYQNLKDLVFDLNNNRKLEFIFCDDIDIIRLIYDEDSQSYVLSDIS